MQGQVNSIREDFVGWQNEVGQLYRRMQTQDQQRIAALDEVTKEIPISSVKARQTRNHITNGGFHWATRSGTERALCTDRTNVAPFAYDRSSACPLGPVLHGPVVCWY
jgi:hypothetical protein